MKDFKSNEGCIICGDNNACYHHIHSKKSRPDLRQNHNNLMSLCLKHHQEIHSIGRQSFIKKYNLDWYMFAKGWIQTHDGKWFLDIAK